MSNHHVIDLIVKNSPHWKWIEDNTIYLTLHGSRAYNTHTKTSDTDIKGITIPPRQYFLGMSNYFEQAELKPPYPDAVIYDIRKFFSLAAACNPSIIEVLFTDPSDQIFVSGLGEEILNNKELFLSKRIRFTFSGYATSQLKKIQLHRQYFLNPPKEKPTRTALGLPEHTLIPQDQLMAAEAEIKKELDRMNFDFMEELSEPMKINVRNTMSEMLAELKLNSEDQWRGVVKKIGFDDNFIELMQKERAYKNAKTEWDNYQHWKNNRNPSRAADEMKFGYSGKNAYHLVRLMRMCREILTTGKVIVKRPDREELLSIRNGQWPYEQLVEFAEKEDQELGEIYKTSTVLPKVPDMQYLDQLCIRLVEQSLSKG